MIWSQKNDKAICKESFFCYNLLSRIQVPQKKPQYTDIDSVWLIWTLEKWNLLGVCLWLAM